MPVLFGLDIAKIVNDSIREAGGVLDVTLTKIALAEPPEGDLSSGGVVTQATYPCKGFFKVKSATRINRTIAQEGGELVSILGASLPEGVEPETDDFVTIENDTYKIIAVIKRDPAAALYTMEVKS